MHRHVPVEFAGADADECDAIAVLRIHVCLNLEDKAGERRVFRCDFDAAHYARFGRGRMLEETVEQELHAKIVHAAAEKDGRALAGQHGGIVENFAGMLEHLAKPVTMDRLVPIILRHARQAPHDRRQPLIDRNRLKDRYGDRAAFIAKLLATVRTTHAGTAAELRAAARDGDLLRLSVMAHTIKGSAGNLAASALLDLAQQTEDAARAGRGETAVTLAIELAATIEALLVELAEETP